MKSSTLTYNDNIRRLGFTTINDVKVVQYDCTIPSDNPKNMRIITTKLNEDLYKANRDICRADLAAFEDACYELQDKYLAQVKTEVE